MVEWPLLFLAASLLAACAAHPTPPAREETAAAPVASPPVVESPPAGETVTVSFAVYTAVTGKQLAAVAAPVMLARAMLDDCSDDCDSLKKTLAVKKALVVTLGTTRDLPPPGFFFSSESIGEKERNRLTFLPAVAMIGVTGSPSPPFPALRAATDAARILAGKVDGLVFDPASYRLQTSKETAFPKSPGSFSPWAHLELGVLELDDGLRAVTFGMAKFGRPDLVVSRVPKADLPIAVAALGAAAAKLVGAEESDRVAMTANDLRNGAKDDSLDHALREGTLDVRLKATPRRPSDPVNRLLRLEPGDDQEQGLAGALAALFLREGDHSGVGPGASSL